MWPDGGLELMVFWTTNYRDRRRKACYLTEINEIYFNVKMKWKVAAFLEVLCTLHNRTVKPICVSSPFNYVQLLHLSLLIVRWALFIQNPNLPQSETPFLVDEIMAWKIKLFDYWQRRNQRTPLRGGSAWSHFLRKIKSTPCWVRDPYLPTPPLISPYCRDECSPWNLLWFRNV